MFIKYFAVIFLLILRSNSYSQYELKLKEEKSSVKSENKNIFTGKAGELKTSKSVLPFVFYAGLFINPMVLLEDKKVHFGLTKELSFGYYPYGRLAFEYSFIVRERNTSHLRLSYNYDFILEAGNFAAFVLAPGAGYFTDTGNKGWFSQVSFGLLIPAFISAIFPYIKYRHTFIQNKPEGKTYIDDLSLGIGFVLFLND